MESAQIDTGALARPSIDFLILADRAEAISGKLYLMGGAWDRLSVQDFDQSHPLSFAIGILVPWNATNQVHGLRIVLQDADGHDLFQFQGQITTGRPPWAVTGQTQRVVLALPAVPVRFPKPGTYIIRAYINDEPDKRTELHVVQAHQFAGPLPVPPQP